MNDKQKVQTMANQITDLTLHELVQLCDLMAQKFGFDSAKDLILASSPSSSSEAVSNDEPEQAQNKVCDISLVDINPSNKVSIIKKIKETLGCPIMSAKEMVENMPTKLKISISHSDADAMIKEWAEIGATLQKQ